jgi:hypothetical protein
MRKPPTVCCDDEKDNYLVQGWKVPGAGWLAELEVKGGGASRYLECQSPSPTASASSTT